MHSVTAPPPPKNDFLRLSSLPSKLRAGLKLVLIVFWALLMLALLWLASALKKPALRDRMLLAFNRGLLVILGMRLTVSGELSAKRPLLLVTNHVSYLDIILLASCATVRFTPKSEIAKWPYMGTLCRVTGCIFIDRRPEQVGEMKNKLKDALAAGEVVCLFPEATTGNGVYVKEFKSGFFSLAQEDFGDQALSVQPAAIAYRHISGLPIDSTQWPMIAWYGDMDLLPHLWQLLCLPGISAELVFLPPQQAGNDRKALASHCQKAVAGAIEEVRQRPKAIKIHKPQPFNPIRLRQK